jgi:hypothetical protein
VTDNQGRANWTSLSTLGVSYSQFTTLSTNEGVIVADQPQTTLNFREGAGINLQIISNALYLNTTAFTAIDIDGPSSSGNNSVRDCFVFNLTGSSCNRSISLDAHPDNRITNKITKYLIRSSFVI